MDKQQKRDFNAKNIAEFRSGDGTLSSFGDAPVLLLTTTGAKSGLRRTSPMMYLADDQDPDRVYVFASAAGADTNPAWFENLVAHPESITVEIGREELTADAEVLPEPARARTFAVQADRYPGFAAYQAKTSRPIPVAALNLHRDSK
ncbi:MAG: nitroreductase family deazaflavin-dependent oxidoreductase [Actinomycetota bacterium]|nr:nitroreductase family deazaflavin-dependent oxidoreductase [Actinomycetota bacterium]